MADLDHKDWGEWAEPPKKLKEWAWWVDKPKLDMGRLRKMNLNTALKEANDKFWSNGVQVSLDEGTWELHFQKGKDPKNRFTIAIPSESRDGFKIMNLKDYLSLIYDGFVYGAEFDKDTWVLKVDGKIAIRPAKQESWFSPEDVEKRNVVRKRYAENIIGLISQLKVN